MQYITVIHQLSLLLIVLSSIMLGISGWGEWRALHDPAEGPAAHALLLSAIFGMFLGVMCWLITRKAARVQELGRREAMLLVAASWLFGAALAALPLFLWSRFAATADQTFAFHSYIDAYFEAMSGLTTTGATIVEDLDTIPMSILLWRSMTQWLGGLGIVVLFVAVLPSLGVGAKRLFRLESTGLGSSGVKPQIRETARVLWMIYLGMTAAQILLLKLAGMTWFDSVCHTFTTVATGGFSTRNASIGYYNSVWIDLITIGFMLLAGISFGLYYQAIRGKLSRLWRDTELRLYLGIVLLATILITAMLWGRSLPSTTGETIDMTLGQAARYAAFQVVSLQTTTGFANADFNLWPFGSIAMIIFLMFIGGSAGSTAGGLKLIRLWVMLRVILLEIEKAFRPNVIRPMKVNDVSIDPDMRLGVLAYVLSILGLLLLGAVAVQLFEADNIDFTTSATASLASICNVGPGLEAVGAVENYAWMTPASKITLAMLMVVGRLELFAIIVLFAPRFWRTD